MALSTLVNRCKATVASAPGTGSIALGAAVPGFLSFAAAGVVSGQLVSYLVEDAGAAFEFGQGLVTGTTLARTTILGSSNGGAAVSLTAAALVSATALASDLNAWNLSPSDNRIINGDMAVDQRNNGATGTASNVYTVDRWQYLATQSAKLSWARNPQGATGPGFSYSLRFVSSSAYTPLAGDTFLINQPIEADAVGDLRFGTAGALPVTLSFWVYSSSLTGTFSGALCNGASTRSWPFSFAIPVVGVWTRIIVTIPGDTGGAWVGSGNAAGMVVRFDLGSGASCRAPAGAWWSGNYVGANGAVSLVATNGASLYITGVKLEAGSIATPFNRDTLAKSLADCQRYYQSLAGVLVQVTTTAASQYATSLISFAPMRAAPSAAVGGSPALNNVAAVNLYPAAQMMVMQLQSKAAGPVSWNEVSSAVINLTAEL